MTTENKAIDDCSQHKKDVAGISDMRVLAKMIGDLHYETLAELFEHLSSKLYLDAAKDSANGRMQLGKWLELAGSSLLNASVDIEKAYEICKPFMSQPKTTRP